MNPPTNTAMKPTQTHTPGPWSHTPMQDTIWANDGETKVCTIADLPWVTSPSGRRHSDDATEQANARLIAAAPDLLAALGAMLRVALKCDDNAWAMAVERSDETRPCDAARAAIARAEGKATQ